MKDNINMDIGKAIYVEEVA